MYYYVVKTKVLISCIDTAWLICKFVFTYAKSNSSHDAARMLTELQHSYLNDPKFSDRYVWAYSAEEQSDKGLHYLLFP